MVRNGIFCKLFRQHLNSWNGNNTMMLQKILRSQTTVSCRKMAASKLKINEENDADLSFKWSDDDIQILLEVVRDYKVSQEMRNLDWTKNRAKYDHITIKMKEAYPTSFEGRERITRDRIASKLKKVQAAYKKAVDLKGKSRAGRIVSTVYEICNDNWGTSPAVNGIDDGLESSSSFATMVDIGEVDSPTISTPLSTADEAAEADGLYDCTPSSHGNLVELQSDTGSKGEEDNGAVVVQSTARRQLIDGLLTDHKSTRIARNREKEDIEAKFLKIAREDHFLSTFIWYVT